ncbi:phosphopantetheine-binding protein, partial [Dactylosporangium sp. NPDC051485]|uniref:phosphopantetheine-binding protein n=1 Tax=Dactylosporangium sp. NPDC051485 TaxID=3154846 RepID=UPI0034259DB7
DAPLAAAEPLAPLGDAVTPQAGPAGAAEPGAGDTGDEVTEQVRRIWQEVLRMPYVGLDDDLYDLGGHSLVITQIAARIKKQLGADVAFEVFLDQPTIRGVVDAIRAGQ